ncbi:ABC transporter permease [Aestuariivirga litoralis]|uniref:ABC transporter permease n=1 Tax=Aestuariivirga litoralis TaxID=2650924 RepID=UPI0018C62624|nr:ABC transporter permease [Aestuariivirga litoralis]MBG1232348.1 ABC transporter permease [Aestuariivirga litoralis]
MAGFVSRNAWTFGLAAFLALLLVATKIIQPSFGIDGLDSVSRAALPFALATLGMSIVIIAGGIDLSIGSIMAVASVTAAVMMQGQSDGLSVPIVLFVLAFGALIGAINGALIVITRVPDIVVTLATLFVLEGAAILILESPGGAIAPWLRELIVGGLPIPGLGWIPKSLVVLVVSAAVIWMPISRSKLGLMLYAIGSDKLAAFRSGVPVSRTKIISYALAGLFAALGGLAVTMSTGIGEPIPGPYLLASVAAAVLGGVSLTGGKGGLIGPILAVFILRLMRLDLTLLSVDPNATSIIEGTVMVAVVMFGGLLAVRGKKS